MPSIYEGCVEKVTLMSEDYVQLKFSLAEPVFFPIGAWCEWNGKRYIVTELQNPTYNESTGGYDYELKLDAYYMAWKLRIYKYKNDTDSLNNKEAAFSLTANLKEHVKCFLRCLKEEGYKYNNDTYYSYTVANDIEWQEVKTLTYSSVNYIDALNQIAEEWDTEWWVTESVLHFGKCQDPKETNVDFILGKNVEKMSGSKSKTDYATRVYAFGSNRNMPPNWNKGEAEFTVVSVDKKDGSIKIDRNIFSNYFKQNDKTNVYDFKECYFIKSEDIWDGDVLEGETPFISSTSESFSLKKGEYKIGKNFFADDLSKVLQFRLKIEIKDKDTIVPQYDSLRFFVIAYIGTIKPSGEVYRTTQLYKSELECYVGRENIIKIPLSDFSIQEDNTKCSIIVRCELLTPLSTDVYNVTIAEKTKILFKTSDDYYSIKAQLSRLDKNNNESKIYNATFTTNTNTFYFNYPDDGPTPMSNVGDRFRIKNIINSKLPSWWFKANRQSADVIKAMADIHLPLPSPGYIQIDGTENEETVEKVLVFEDIYPRTLSEISEIRTKRQNVMDDSGKNATGETYTEYYIKQSAFTFLEEYQLKNGENMKVIFQSGALAGLEFEVEFDSSETPQKESGYETIDHQFFRVLRNQFDGGLMLPNEAMKPKIGDEFVLSGWDVTSIDDMLISNAQEELEAATKKELKKMFIDPNTYECTLFSDVAYGKRDITYITDEYGNNIVNEANEMLITDDSGVGLNHDNAWDFGLGRYITLYNAAFFREGKRISRVIGYEKKMDIPWDSPIYTVGEKATYSRLDDMQKQIDGTNIAINTNSSQYTGNYLNSSNGGASVYLIKMNDTTAPSDTNIYSALRARKEFINKQDDAEIHGQFKLLAGIITKSSNNGTETAADGICESIN